MSNAARSEPSDENAGFTIVEALVAIAVIAVSLTAIAALSGTTTRGVRALEQHVALVETARTVAARLPPGRNLTSGDLEGELYGNRWRIDVSPFLGSAVPNARDAAWIPQLVAIHVQSPSGAAIDLETVRLQRKSR